MSGEAMTRTSSRLAEGASGCDKRIILGLPYRVLQSCGSQYAQQPERSSSEEEFTSGKAIPTRRQQPCHLYAVTVLIS